MVRCPSLTKPRSSRSPSAAAPLSSQAGSHIDLRKRNQAFQQKAGKVNKLKPTDPLEKKPLPRWIIILLVFIVGGGGELALFAALEEERLIVVRECTVVFELLQQIVNFLTAKR